MADPPTMTMTNKPTADPAAAQRPATTASVVICAYTDRRWTVLREAVLATMGQDPAPHEVLLVIDHDDALLRRCQAAFGGGVRVLANDGPRGLSGARNTGVAAATGDVVVFLDDDAVPEPGWHAAVLETYADAGVIGLGGPALARWSEDRPGWLPEEFLWTVGCSYRGGPDGTEAIRNPIGANMSFRRKAFAEAGGFTDGLGRIGTTPLGCEETEFAIRVRQRLPGAAIVHCPSARVRHLVTPERGRWAYFRSRCWAEGLSKAEVARRVGRDAALSSERGYALRVLPAGVLRGVAEALRGDAWGVARSGAILAGLLVTTAGYARGRLTGAARPEPA